MKMKMYALQTLALLGSTVVAPNLLEAKSLRTTKLNRMIQKMAKPPVTNHVTSPACSNFGGDWEGQCVERLDPTKITKSAVRIEQGDCIEITIDGFPISNRGSFSAQVAPLDFNFSHLPVSVIESGNWNDAQTRFTVVSNVSVAGMGLHAVDSTSYEMDGETLVVSDGEYNFIMDENGIPATNWHLVKEDCRYTKKP